MSKKTQKNKHKEQKHKKQSKNKSQIKCKEPSLSKIKKQEYYKKILENRWKKPSVCKYFLSGCCRLEDCSYSHDVTPDQMNKFYEPCRYYPTGECAKGEMCNFMHENFPCMFFHNKSGNKCKKGDECLFSHAPLTKELAKALEMYIESQTTRGQVLPVKESEAILTIQPTFGKSLFNNYENNDILTTDNVTHKMDSDFELDIQTSGYSDEEGKEQLALYENQESEILDDSGDNVPHQSINCNKVQPVTFFNLFSTKKSPSPHSKIIDDKCLNDSQSSISDDEDNLSSNFHQPEITVPYRSKQTVNVLENLASDINNIPKFTKMTEDSDSEECDLKIDNSFCSSFIESNQTNAVTRDHFHDRSNQTSVVKTSSPRLTMLSQMSEKSKNLIPETVVENDLENINHYYSTEKQSVFRNNRCIAKSSMKTEPFMFKGQNRENESNTMLTKQIPSSQKEENEKEHSEKAIIDTEEDDINTCLRISVDDVFHVKREPEMNGFENINFVFNDNINQRPCSELNNFDCDNTEICRPLSSKNEHFDFVSNDNSPQRPYSELTNLNLDWDKTEIIRPESSEKEPIDFAFNDNSIGRPCSELINFDLGCDNTEACRPLSFKNEHIDFVFNDNSNDRPCCELINLDWDKTEIIRPESTKNEHIDFVFNDNSNERPCSELINLDVNLDNTESCKHEQMEHDDGRQFMSMDLGDIDWFPVDASSVPQCMLSYDEDESDKNDTHIKSINSVKNDYEVISQEIDNTKIHHQGDALNSITHCSDADVNIDSVSFLWCTPPILILPPNNTYHKMNIDCYKLRHKFDDPRIRNHPNALKPNWADWLNS